MTRRDLILLTALARAALGGQPSPELLEIKGAIESVSISPGRGMPYLKIRAGDHSERVMLGSMRYLMEHDFNPKAGATAEVRGLRTPAGILAYSVKIPDQGISIQLRDSDGRPLWRRGRP